MKCCSRSLSVSIVLIAMLSGCQIGGPGNTSSNADVGILEAYANQARDAYSRALDDAMQMQRSIDRFAAKPSSGTLAAAKDSWLNARESYGVTEIFRLSNGPIDAEEGWVANAYGTLEGQINAWPLDENMIDYSIDENGNRTSGNIIDTAGVFNPGGEDSEVIDVRDITTESIASLNENGGDANVASGYHAIEFLLWGQDQDYANFSEDSVTRGALIAGQRPLGDFTDDAHAERRLQYLQAASALLIDNLKTVSDAWSGGASGNCEQNATGCYRAALLGQLEGSDKAKNIQPAVALRQIVSGMGVFIKSELANERIAVAVLTPSEEDEHSCFSDNTHRDITLNYQGFVNVLKSTYGGKSYWESFYSKARPDTRHNLDSLIQSIDERVENMNQLAASKWHFDYQILPQNNAREIRKMKNDMRKLGDQMVNVASDIGLNLSTNDVTDPEETRI